MHVFYRVMKGIYQFAANLLSYIPTKYYWNRSINIWLSYCEKKRVNFFFETQCIWNKNTKARGGKFFIRKPRMLYKGTQIISYDITQETRE